MNEEISVMDGARAMVERGAAVYVGPTREEIELIKKTVAVGASDLDLKMFLYTCKKTGLDPILRQIYWIKRGDKGTIQVGIDGYRLIADRTNRYAGNDAPTFDTVEGQFNPLSATVTVWKLVGGLRCPFTATALWSEYYPGDRQGDMWRKRPFGQLSKCAESLALRKAFPAELSGMYTHEEMEQADNDMVIPAPRGNTTRQVTQATTIDVSSSDTPQQQAPANVNPHTGEIAEAGETLAGTVNTTGTQCPSCHCPDGKKHTPRCEAKPTVSTVAIPAHITTPTAERAPLTQPVGMVTAEEFAVEADPFSDE